MKKVFVYLLGIMVFFFVACSSEKTGDTETAAADSTGTDVAVAPANFWEGEVSDVVYGEAGTPSEAEAAVTYTVDAASSSVAWYGEKAAYGHNGTIDVQEGRFEVVDGKVVGGFFIIDMTTIKDLDIDDAEKNGKLVGHLSSDDFFNVEMYPSASLVITKAASLEGSTYMVSGNLTIRDKTQQVTFPATIDVADDGVTAEATFAIDRSKFDVKYNSGTLIVDLAADQVISDDIAFNIQLVASPSEAAQAE